MIVVINLKLCFRIIKTIIIMENTNQSSENKTNVEPSLTSEPELKMPINPNMDEANKTAANVFNTQGEKAFLKHIFTDQETGRQMSYAEMRYRYG